MMGVIDLSKKFNEGLGRIYALIHQTEESISNKLYLSKLIYSVHITPRGRPPKQLLEWWAFCDNHPKTV